MSQKREYHMPDFKIIKGQRYKKHIGNNNRRQLVMAQKNMKKYYMSVILKVPNKKYWYLYRRLR